MNKRSKDYIPYACEIEAAREAARERIKNTADPRHMYHATYVVNGTSLSENVMAYDIKNAELIIKQQLGMVGWIPVDLKIVAAEDTNTNIK